MAGEGKEKRTYAAAGVDISKQDQVLARIKPLCESTHDEYVLGGIGPFGAMFDLGQYLHDCICRHPILVHSVDGPGTLPMLAKLIRDQCGGTKYFEIAGYNTAVHCFCDIGTSGATPITLLDNISSTDMDPDTHEAIVRGMVGACREAECCLVGGECAQLSGVIVPGQYDFCAMVTGLVEKADCIDPKKRITPGLRLIGIASRGLHLNGWSLQRQIVFDPDKGLGLNIDDIVDFSGKSVGVTFITRQPNYALIVDHLLRYKVNIRGNGHITGGGLYDNVARILPEGCRAVIDSTSWPMPETFHWLVEKGNVELSEAYKTWNMGIGWVMAVYPADVSGIIREINSNARLDAWEIGQIVEGERGVEIKF